VTRNTDDFFGNDSPFDLFRQTERAVRDCGFSQRTGRLFVLISAFLRCCFVTSGSDDCYCALASERIQQNVAAADITNIRPTNLATIDKRRKSDDYSTDFQY
jgi:hypothetical protein